MIKLAVITGKKNYFQKLANRLHGEKDISIISTIIIKNHKSEKEQTDAFMKQMVEQQPDICLLEQAVLRDAAALDLKKMLDYKNRLPKMKLIVIGVRFIEENVMAMMQGGVRGFIRFAQGNEQLIKCIRKVAQGEICLEAKLITPVFDEFIKEYVKRTDNLKSLTDLSLEKLKVLSRREMEIVELISHSMTNEEIADKLFISYKTVNCHVRNIFKKAGIKNRVEAALLYARRTLIHN
jgi:DNA-binding NarL/FixJ family response regulator